MANIETSEFKVEEPKRKANIKKTAKLKLQDANKPRDIFFVLDQIGKIMTDHCLDQVEIEGIKLVKTIHLKPTQAQKPLTEKEIALQREAELFHSGI